MASRKIAKSNATPKKSRESKGVGLTDKFAEEFVAKLRAEGPVLPEGFSQDVDDKIRADWARRAGLVFLEKPFKEMMDAIANDRKTAVAFAAAADAIDKSAQRYTDLVRILRAARIRISVALCSRADLDDVIAKARSGKGQSGSALIH